MNPKPPAGARTQKPSLPAEILWVSRYHYLPGQRLLVHRHPHFHQVFLVLQGQGTFQMGTRTIPMNPGDLFLAMAKTPHGFQSTGRKPVQTLEVKFTVHGPSLKKELRKAGEIFHDRTGVWRGHLDFILAEALSNRPHRDTLASLRFAELLYGLIQQGTGAKNPAESTSPTGTRSISLDPWVRQVVGVMEARYGEPLSVSAIAAALGCSVRKVSGPFREVMGETVMDHLWNLRLHRAKTLVLTESASLEAIAHQCGFETVQHFNRLFKAREGVPPGRWRQREKRRIGDGVNFGRFVNRTPGKPSLVN